MWNIRVARIAIFLLACTATGFAQSSEGSPAQAQESSAAKPADTSQGQAQQPLVPQHPITEEELLSKFPPQPVRARRQVHQIPCWKQAGIAPQMVNERWRIEDRGRIKIAGACSDPALSAEKKHDRIQQINAETDQEIANLIPAKQLQAFKACQLEREKSRPKLVAEKQLGPCGGVIPATASNTEVHQHGH